jgi:hypothetical protein
VEKDEQIPTRVPLPEPRPLTAKERALIEFLLASPVAREELRLQVETVAVDAVCSCGCPSVWLRVDPATPVAQFSAEESPTHRADWVPITANQQKMRGATEVTLHVVRVACTSLRSGPVRMGCAREWT